jgi:hypothetical protein
VISSACTATTGAVAWTTLNDWSDKRDDFGASVSFDTVYPFAAAAGIPHAKPMFGWRGGVDRGLIDTLSSRCAVRLGPLTRALRSNDAN